MSKRARRVDDPLWKSVLEQTFSHFLEFMYDEAASVFDLNKPFDYLDKEFESLFPPEANGKGVRYVDKLVKVYLKDGGEKFILCHIEKLVPNSLRDTECQRTWRPGRAYVSVLL